MSFFKNLFNNKPVIDFSTLIKNGAQLVDVRSPNEFAEGSAPNAINIPLQQIEQHLAAFDDKIATIVFCRSGNRSGMAKTLLNAKGYNNVFNGGTWQEVAAIVNNVNI